MDLTHYPNAVIKAWGWREDQEMAPRDMELRPGQARRRAGTRQTRIERNGEKQRKRRRDREGEGK